MYKGENVKAVKKTNERLSHDFKLGGRQGILMQAKLILQKIGIFIVIKNGW